MENPISIEKIEFSGELGIIPAYVMIPKNTNSLLYVVLPGAGYSFRQALLHFSIQVLLKKGFRVLAIDKIYGDDSRWASLSSEAESRKIVANDSISLFQKIHQTYRSHPHTVIGRLLGAYALSCALEAGVLEPSQIIWQTPALANN